MLEIMIYRKFWKVTSYYLDYNIVSCYTFIHGEETFS